MRLALIALMLLLAGCLDAEVPGATTDPPRVEPFEAEGIVFLPPTQSQDRAETHLPFPVKATVSRIAVDVILGSRYGPLDAPPFPSDVLVELRAPGGAVLAEARLDTQTPEAHLEAETNATGEHDVVLLSYGGSDERSMGDYVDWRIEVAPPASA